jgi:uncharacterized protein (TIGR03435 family)
MLRLRRCVDRYTDDTFNRAIAERREARMRVGRVSALVIIMSFAVGPLLAAFGVGARAPRVRIKQTIQGISPESLDRATKGKVVVLEFWATWCAPCIAAIPHLNALVQNSPKDVVFLSVTDEEEDRVRRFLAKHALKGSVALDTDGATTKAFGVHALPTTIIIDGDGVIVARTMPDRVTEEAILRYRRGTPQTTKVAAKKELPAEVPATAPTPILQVEIAPTDLHEDLYSLDSKRGRLSATAIQVRSLFSTATGLNTPRIVGPASLLDRWVSATIQVPAGADFANTILQALSTAFGVRVRRETRDVAVYRLRVSDSKAPALLAATASERKHLSSADGVIAGANFNIAALASELEDALQTSVVDETGLKGNYDWDLTFVPGNAADIVRSVKNQLGLDLIESKAPLEVAVIELNPPAPIERK